MLTQAQIDEYNEVGAIVVPDVLTSEEVARLRAVTDGFVERARGVAAHNEIYDLEDSHTPENPRVRRIKAAHMHHPEYAALSRHPRILAVPESYPGASWYQVSTIDIRMLSDCYPAALQYRIGTIDIR